MNYYVRFKSQHPDYVILARNHYVYTLFADDADLGSRLLQLPSDSLLLDNDESIAIVSFAYAVFEKHLGELVENGYGVWICDKRWHCDL